MANAMNPVVSAFVLCGGASSRMGKPKGLLKFGDQPLILRIASLLEPLVSAVTAVGSPERYVDLGLHVIDDAKIGIPDESGKTAGPLCGIASALISTRTEWNLILACDLPYLSAEWLDWLLGRAMANSSRYKSSCRAPQEALNRWRRSIVGSAPSRFLRRCTAESTKSAMHWNNAGSNSLPNATGEHLDPAGRVLYNMNAPEDYEEARRWVEGQRP